ncbi:MAG TPA: methyltransferase domain-containing protein [Terriglobia bacterium]|nr:methyltransferase domain-containing protein [Terriglobia bacterium]
MSTIDPRAFRQFEHRGWQEIASRYHGGFASVTTQSVMALLDAAHVTKGTRLLDVACGPGYAAAAAAARGAIATGVDFSSEMVEEARGRYPGIDFQEDDAEQLSISDSSFDAVVLNFGMLHLARPEQALAEAYRVLRPGGRVAFTVWDTSDKAIGFGIVLSAIQKHGDLNVPIPPGPPFFRFSDPEESKRTLTGAGFVNPVVTHVPQTWRLPSPEVLFDVMYNGSVRNAALLRAQKPDVLEAIRREIHDAVAEHRNELAMPAVLSSGEKTGVIGRDEN